MRQATDGMPFRGSESHSSSNGPSLTTSSARNLPVL